MTEEIYRRLAQTLDALPHGFPATSSGVELRLLAKIFTPEEAMLASEMRPSREPAGVIAARLGIDPETAYRTLKTMARKGLIRAGRKEGQMVFGLMPFVVGFYEEQLPRLDRELAELFEQYFREAQGAVTRYAPPVHRVIPVEEAIPAGVEIYAYEQATELLEKAKAWGVRACICRVQQKLVGKGCDRPVENCLVLAPVEGLFDHDEVTRAISKEEALQILREAEEAGLVHSPGNYRDGNYYICNCCTCCCAVLRSVAEFSLPTAIAKSDFVNRVEESLCVGCGECLERCHFGALAVRDNICVVDTGRCVGCGLCAMACSTGALHLERRPPGEVPPPPADYQEWMAQRARTRGLGGPS
ncbi:MAG: 4Fe-4S binding protein [Anaerolineae bacterium]